MSDSEAKARSYAWDWFTLHASQRLQLVNFWLVAVAFLASAFVQARANHLYIVAFGVSVIGAISSLAFMRLDVRTGQLIQVAETALEYFERSFVADGLDDATQLVKASNKVRKSRFDSYRVIIRGLQLGVGATFVIAAIYSLASW